MTTKSSMGDKTLSMLQELIQVNIDSCKGFQQAAEIVVDMSLASTFRQIASQRRHQAEQLKWLISQAGERPEDSGSAAGTAHRAWMDFRSVLGGGVSAVLAEAERGEDRIKEKYEEVLEQAEGSLASELIDRQYTAVKESHDCVRDLRDAHDG